MGASTVNSGTCHAGDADDCSEVVSEADVATMDDAHAADIRVSLMQKEHLHLKLSKQGQVRHSSHSHSHLKRSKQKQITKDDPDKFVETSGNNNWEEEREEAASERVWLSDLVNCTSGDGELISPVLKTQEMTLADYDEVVKAINDSYVNLVQDCNFTDCMQATWAGCVVNLAAHDFMDFRSDQSQGDGQYVPSGGSDGCISLTDAGNEGLIDCFNGTTVLEQMMSGDVAEKTVLPGLVQIYNKEFCSRISLADFVVIAAEAVINITRQPVLNSEKNPYIIRKPIDFRSQFKFGRTTATSCDDSIGFMPNPQKGCDAVNASLVSNLGLTWNQSAALMGARIFDGRYAGYGSASRLFNNDYYVSLVTKGWAPVHGLADDPDKTQWLRTDLGADIDAGLEGRLDSDMCLYHYMFDDLVYDEELYPDSKLNAKAAEVQNCKCAWTRVSDFLEAIEKYNGGEFCGSKTYYPVLEDLGFGAVGHMGQPTQNTLQFAKQRASCCGIRPPDQQLPLMEPSIDCGLPSKPLGKAAAAIKIFANSEEAWIDSFVEAWGVATTKREDIGEMSDLLYKLEESRWNPTEEPRWNPTVKPSI
jgi:hypothetical protein